MKRLMIAAALLLTVAALCILCQLALERQTRALVAELDGIRQLYEAGEEDACRARIGEFAQKVEQRTHWFPFFLRHTELTGLEETAAQLPAVLEAEDDRRFSAEMARCRQQLLHLREMERITWENIM